MNDRTLTGSFFTFDLWNVKKPLKYYLSCIKPLLNHKCQDNWAFTIAQLSNIYRLLIRLIWLRWKMFFLLFIAVCLYNWIEISSSLPLLELKTID